MSTIVTINSTDQITNSRADLNTNFSNLNSGKIETSVIDTDTALAANSDAKLPSQKAVKAYVDTLGNVNASETARGIVEEATDAEMTAGTATGGTGAKLFVTPAKLATFLPSKVKFGGTGADGALTVSSGTTTIDLGSAQVVIKNYTSISITGTGKIAFSNPHANGTTIIFKSQGNVTLTSSQTPMIDASNCGASAMTAGYGFMLYHSNGATGGTRLSSSTADYAAGASPTADITNTVIHEAALKYSKSLPGAGGGNATIYKSNSQNDYTGTAGTGGRGGGVLIIECAGAWNFTTTGGISVSGSNGTNGTATSPGSNTFIWADGGGPGGPGCFYGFYATLTANTGTVTAATGSAGSSAGAGSTSGSGLSAGAGTGVGYSLIAKNTEYS